MSIISTMILFKLMDELTFKLIIAEIIINILYLSLDEE